MPDVSNPPISNFKHDPSCSPFAVSQEEYIASQLSPNYQNLGTGAIVFDNPTSSDRRILLVQRAATDSMPGCWEFPGGGVDDDDKSILHAVARELWEEAGLTAVNIGPLIGKPERFKSRSGKQICKFNFMVEAEGAEGAMVVKLDPTEHQKYLWISKEEVRQRKAGDLELVFTTAHTEALVLEAFSISS